MKRFDVGLFKSANLFKLAIKICWNAAMVGIFISEFINQMYPSANRQCKKII